MSIDQIEMAHPVYPGIIIPVNVTGKNSKSSFKIRHWQRYYLHNLAPFRYTCKPRHFDSRGAAPTTDSVER